MTRILEGNFEAKGLRVAIVASRFNDFIVSKLVDGAVDTLVRHGGNREDITLAWVPGSFEIPATARRLARPDKFDALICLGCVIRGGTGHYEHVAGEAAKGIGSLAAQCSIPVIFGLLTTNSIEQAIERAGTKMGNKGADAALAAIEMVNLNLRIDSELG